jgi:hypothetical protein
MRGRNLKIE